MYESFDPVSRSFSLVCFCLPLVGTLLQLEGNLS